MAVSGKSKKELVEGVVIKFFENHWLHNPADIIDMAVRVTCIFKYLFLIAFIREKTSEKLYIIFSS